MRMYLYQFLVNRHAGIRTRYHRVHDGVSGVQRLFSYVYLLWLNFCYYILFCRFLDREKQADIYEEKRLPIRQSESSLAYISADEMAEHLAAYDVISFDIFDTLIFRPFSQPADLFFFLSEQFPIMDLKRIRMEQEILARKECRRKNGHSEITLGEIWERMEQEVGIPKEEGMKAECSLEMRFCYANPFLQQIFQKLLKQGKRILIISDMYLPAGFLRDLLKNCGYEGYDGLYVSGEYRRGKADGGLYDLVKTHVGGSRWIHVGDNRDSDDIMAKKKGIAALHYPNVNQKGALYRASDLSPMVGSAWRGIVNSHLYCGQASYSMDYEYGFVCGGIFVLGYVNFIHRYCQEHGISRILFLSRDGDILKQIYDVMYPGEDTAYAYWSRRAAVKLMAEYDRYDFFRRCLYHKVNQNITIRKLFADMELSGLAEEFPGAEEVLTDKNVEACKAFLQLHWDEVTEIYQRQHAAAKRYYSRLTRQAERVAAVDIGWAGSGAVSLSYLMEHVWKLPCELTGIIAGTNTIANAEPEASEYFLQSGKLVSYLYSMSHNRDLMKKHDPGRGYNIYWELLLASPQRKFLGFDSAGTASDTQNGSIREGYIPWEGDARVMLGFGECEDNQEGIYQIRQGIMDFVNAYTGHFKEDRFMLDISGRDAYAPMLAASGFQERYLKEIASHFAPEEGI